jgi:hypothetical protein
MIGYKAFYKGLKPITNYSADTIDYDDPIDIHGIYTRFTFQGRIINEHKQYELDTIYCLNNMNGLYEACGKTYSTNNPPLMWKNGFRFTDMPLDLFKKFDDDPNIEYAMIHVLGDMVHNLEYNYSLTNKFKIIKVMSKDQILDMMIDGKTVTLAGDQITIMNKVFHSIADNPAIIRASGDMYWYKEGKLHRPNDLPAIIRVNTNHFYDESEPAHSWTRLIRFQNKPYTLKDTDLTDKEWYENGIRFRADDKPSVITADNTQYWHSGLDSGDYLYRANDKPSIIGSNGTQYWYILDYYPGADKTKENFLHRDYNDGPAIIESNGTTYWFKYNKPYRAFDRPTGINSYGCQKWMQSNDLFGSHKHRDNDLPALIHSATCPYYPNMQEWWIDGKRHRNDDKPAIIDNNGYKAWYNDGDLIKEEYTDLFKATYEHKKNLDCFR